ncbi:MAG: ABC transporter ATP-binding protein [Pseudomonadota bacterium]
MIIEAKALTLKQGPRTVLRDADLIAEPGGMVALLGPNGAGKSTLLRALAGLHPLHAGTVSLDGATLATLPRRLRAHHIAYLPQARDVHWPLSVEHIVALGRLPHGGFKGATPLDDAAVIEALETMALTALIGRPGNELSGGELARCLVARALAQETPIILADEPTAGLDPAHQLALFDHIDALAAAGRTIIVALHDLTLAARYARHAVLLEGARILASGPTQTVLTRDHLRQAFGIEARVKTIDGMAHVIAARAARPG